MCCLSYDQPSTPHLYPSNRYPKCHEAQRPPKARRHPMEYKPHGKQPERRYTQLEAHRRPKAGGQNEEYVPRGGANLFSNNRKLAPLSSHPISPNSTAHPHSTAYPLPHNDLIPNRFANLSAVSSLHPDDIQDTNTVQSTAKLRAPRARVGQVIDRLENGTPGRQPDILRPLPAAVLEYKPKPRTTVKRRKRSVRAETKHRLSRPWDDMTEWPPAHNPNRLSRPFDDMPACYREKTPPPPPTIAQRRREKKKAQAEKQEHMLWHGSCPPRKEPPFLKEQLGAAKGKRGQDVWYCQMSLV
ncbi:hypothetical protein JMJ35_001420 [Cladonia borealis]|uniref:Uncharacterized protein n=1 Tax=Cladonia borealis TaxID=184061 RepID=A0AA39R8B8_9LECA|nr:hypothetical protein JMJ35_001420 [Cladonia borealis]